jgi:hypothetical protein
VRDRVTPALHEHVLRRDGACFVAVLLGPEHQCRDQWGQPHSPYDQARLTVDHVWDVPGGVRGRRAPSDERHLVAMCAAANISGPSRAVREAERLYLLGLYALIVEPDAERGHPGLHRLS